MKIAIYGTGDNAKLILEEGTEKLCCVISEDSGLKEFCGCKVVGITDAVQMADAILIAAVPVSTSIIYNRIKDKVPEGMPVYDIRGHYLNEDISAIDYVSRFIGVDADRTYCERLLKTGSFSNGEYKIDSYQSVASLVMPITVSFLKYMGSFVNCYDHILFPARDGYFLLEAYRRFIEGGGNNPNKAKYLLTSRDAIKNADGNYRKYIDFFGVTGSCAIIDIVTQGTVVAGISNMIGRDIDLIAMGTTELPNDFIDDLGRVHSLFGQINERKGEIRYSFDDFSELHLFLEMLYASDDGQFLGIDNNGLPIFKENEYSAELIKGVQVSLTDMLDEYDWQSDDIGFSPGFTKALLRMFYRKFADYDASIREQFTFDDPYDTRMHACNLIDKLGW